MKRMLFIRTLIVFGMALLLQTSSDTAAEDETFDIGQDTRTGVAMIEYRYDVPFKFTGKINKLTFKLGLEPKAAPER